MARLRQPQQCRSNKVGEQSPGVADVERGLSALDFRGELVPAARRDRFENLCRATVGRGPSRRAVRQTRFLATGDVDRLAQTGFRQRPVRFRPPECDLAVEAMLLG